MIMLSNDQDMYHCNFNGLLAEQRITCSGWLPSFAPLGGITANSPALTAPFEGRLEAYAVGRDDRAMYFRYYQDGAWTDWASLGQPDGITFTSNPAAVGWWGIMTVFARGSDNALWQRSWRDGGWQPWESRGGVFTSGPAACKVWDGRIHVFGRGQDGVIWFSTFDGGWDGWSPIPRCPVDLTADAPAAVGGRGLVHVYARATNDSIWRCHWEPGGWRPWENVNPPVSDASRRLTDAILERNLATTQRRLIPATFFLGAGLPFIGPVRNYVTWRTPSDDDCYHWSSTDELRKLIRTLREGVPMPLGLIDYTGWGHEVVAYGLQTDLDLPPGSPEDYALPGGQPWHIKIYDPNHPGCDDVVLTLDPNSTVVTDGRVRRILQSTGETRRGFFVRDDYEPIPPPV
jgi:hypothetical protein